ncbi:pentapeptide repeat-containing protein [Sphaerospermopsis torques-reginae ITEP-024]|uniref:Pentapeptide repeat-containing protein n=1 Tax=Sphaerospermopsis torques-reginae ITEP-024 TaxID=984208 RepID=A0ABX8WXD6_9CYAN|nr:pentapeptide repeat-containing protein [Sphaerospermopsis torques-reginae ITEP-024]
MGILLHLETEINFIRDSISIYSRSQESGVRSQESEVKRRANLYLASLKDAILSDAILEGANLREAKFTI